MYTLPTELFSSITSQLTNGELLLLSRSSTTLRTGLQTVSTTSKFWQGRCSTLLEVELGDYTVNWKRVYQNLSYSTSLIKNVVMGNTDAVLILLEANGVDPSVVIIHTIQLASANGHLEVVKLLLDQPGVDPTADDNYAIQLASENGHLEVVKLLLDQPGVDPTADDNYAIGYASENGHLEVVKLLLEHGANPTVGNNYATRMASLGGHMDVVRLLLEQPGVHL
jgi:ankyrin repeat protein